MVRRNMMHCLVIAAAILPVWGRMSQAQTDVNELYVINSLAETLDRIDLITGTVQHDVAVLGLYPNRIWVNDTMAVVVNSGDATLQVIRLTNFTTIGLVHFNENDNPYDLAVCDDTLAYVTLFGSHELACCNLRTRTVVGRVEVGYHPEGVLVQGGRVYVTNTAFDDIEYEFAQGTVYAIDRSTFTVVDSVYVSRNPQTLIAARDGTIHVVCTGNYVDEFGRIDILDPGSLSVIDHLDIGGSPGIIWVDQTHCAYLAEWGWGQGYLYKYNTLTRQVLRGTANPIAPGHECAFVVGDPSDNLYICEFNIDKVGEYDPADTPTGRDFAVGDGPVAAALRTNRLPGDANEDRMVTPTDVVWVANYVYRGFPLTGRLSAADVNQSCEINPADVVLLVNHVYKGWGVLLWGCVP